MRSERRRITGCVLTAALLGGLIACGPVAELGNELFHEEDERLTKTCEQVDKCGGVVKQLDCESDLEDMIGDGRVTEERAVVCAACMASNKCEEIRDKRHCDTACQGVGYVQNMFTSECTRSTLCDDVLEVCVLAAEVPDCEHPGTSESSLSCRGALIKMLKDSPELDRQLATCAECVARAKDPPVDTEEVDCEDVLAQCQTTCSPIPEIKARLDRGGSAALRLCAALEGCGDTTTCTVDLLAKFAESSPPTEGTLLECESCLRMTPCDSPTRSADCATKCSGLGLDL
jgi:hypothetical protein